MEIPSSAWLSELEMEEPHEFINQHQPKHPYYSDSLESFSSESFNGYPNLVNQSIQATTINGDLGKQQTCKAIKTSPFAPSYGSSSNTFTISFGNLTTLPQTNTYQPFGGSKLKYSNPVKPKEEMNINEYFGSMEVPKRVPNTIRNHRQAQEHVLAERKRREKLTQRFVSLSALLPEFKKMDKATVLEDASKYIIELQKRVKELEETYTKRKDVSKKSTVSIRKSNPCGRPGGEDTASSSEGASTLPPSNAYDPEIEVRISGSSILVRIYCRRNSSLILKALNEMERLHFTIVSSSVLPFSSTDLLITITAKMSDEFVMTAMDLVTCLQSALRNFL